MQLYRPSNFICVERDPHTHYMSGWAPNPVQKFFRSNSFLVCFRNRVVIPWLPCSQHRLWYPGCHLTESLFISTQVIKLSNSLRYKLPHTYIGVTWLPMKPSSFPSSLWPLYARSWFALSSYLLQPYQSFLLHSPELHTVISHYKSVSKVAPRRFIS